jgi:hypothetical protein
VDELEKGRGLCVGGEERVEVEKGRRGGFFNLYIQVEKTAPPPLFNVRVIRDGLSENCRRSLAKNMPIK